MRYLGMILACCLFFNGCATTRISTEERQKRQNIVFAVFPLENDKWDATNTVIQNIIDLGYSVVERTELYRVFDEMKLQMSGITEQEAVKAGQILNVDFIIVGNAYSQYKEYIPPNTVQPNYSTMNVNEAAAQGFANGIAQGIQESKAGTFIYASCRCIEVKTGKVINTHTEFIGKY